MNRETVVIIKKNISTFLIFFFRKTNESRKRKGKTNNGNVNKLLLSYRGLQENVLFIISPLPMSLKALRSLLGSNPLSNHTVVPKLLWAAYDSFIPRNAGINHHKLTKTIKRKNNIVSNVSLLIILGLKIIQYAKR
jgi:hypothetical protein